MKKINFTIDNQFRHPLRWGTMSQVDCFRKIKIFGFTFEKKLLVGQIGTQWILIFYFYKWYRAYSNYRIN